MKRNPNEIHLVRDVLDKQIVDPKRHPLGRADGLVLIVEDDQPPRLETIESGIPILARRISRRLGRWTRALGRRFGLRRGAPLRISFSRLKSTGIELQMQLDAEHSLATRWDQWLFQHITRHIPSLKPRREKQD
jgi:hypothetical protein